MTTKLNTEDTESSNSVRIDFNPLEELHDHCQEKMQVFSKRVTDRLLSRYCAVCFFHPGDGVLFNIPICNNCQKELFPNGFEKIHPREFEIFRKMAMLGRDARESLYLQLVPVDDNKEG